jgi:N-acetylglucosaminyldiphosphoundecaprenol N-acetyl-beta-D-mannosaminyltransferase
MIDFGKRDVVGVLINAIDYDAATERVIASATSQTPLTLSAAASHAVMIGHGDPEQRYRLNHLDLIVPDGQPVRHALRVLYGIRLPDRVYGPNLMLRVCERAASEGLAVYLFGSGRDVVDRLAANLSARFPRLRVAGAEPSSFRTLSEEERDALAGRIRASGAGIVFVGLGCPRQETWAYEMRDRLGVPVLAVGAAFDFHAGTLAQAPDWMQDRSLEWLYRLLREPRRLWKRYLGLGPRFIGLVLAQKLGVRRFDSAGREPLREQRFG